MSKLRLIHNSAIFILIWNGLPALATVYDSDGSSTNIQYIHDTLAQDGDTVTLPAGIFTWLTGVNVTKAITLQGAGVGQTIINGGAINWDYSQSVNGLARITGIESNSTMYSVTGRNDLGSQFRWDHCKVTSTSSQYNINTVIGVIDHNQFFHNGILFDIGCGSWNGDPLNRGDYSWIAPTALGTSQFLFIEDNVFTDTNTSKQAVTDATKGGGRFVVRYNTLYHGTVNSHGTESSRRFRSVRAAEIYNNNFIGTNDNNLLAQERGGVWVMHDNHFSGWSPHGFGTAAITLKNYHMSSSDPPWGSGDGTNPWDVNDPAVYDSGNISAINVRTVTVPGKNWPTNQWTKYTIRRTGVTGFQGSEIVSNTANTITFAQGHDGDLTFNVGDGMEIRKVIQCIDCVGRAGGSLITQQSPTPPPAWNDQVTEPCYSWNNVDEFGNSVGFAGDSETIRPGEHVFNNTPMPGYTPFTYPHPLVTDPPMPSPTPTVTVTPSSTPTPTPTPSPTSPPSPTPSPAPSPTPTSTPAATPTATPTPTATATATATTTPEPSSTPTPTPTATATATATATPRHTPKPHPSHGPVKG